jgi:hypothetical protein
MAIDNVIISSSSRSWFKLGDLMDSMLADVIAVDANFQLTQAEAWGRFSKAVSDLGTIPMIDQLDFSVGFGRLENLGLSELSISVPLEIYRPGWMKRLWWGVLRIFGRKTVTSDERFRLARSGNKGIIELQIKARRDEYGHWAVSKE